jgi:hypothetical protein
MNDIEGPLSLSSSALSLVGEVHIGARTLLINVIWFGYFARLSQRKEGDILLVHLISTCLRWA